MKKTILAALFLTGYAIASMAQSCGAYEHPKLVIGIIVDQMRWDYLDYYYDKFGEGGFKRLISEGYNCDNHFINYIPSVTAAGHASTYTGSVPAINGIAGNNFMIHGQKTYCTDDPTVAPVGSSNKEGKMSPRNLLTATIGDQLKLATDFKSKVIGVSLKDRASILPAGHAADAAYWFDNKDGVFISSTYYMDKLPQWVNDFNRQHCQSKDIRLTPMGNTIVADMAMAAINGEELGNHEVTDFLAVSFSSTDYIGHEYGTRSPITQEAYIQLDRDLSRIFDLLDRKLGKGNYLAFLSADHAASHNADFQRAHKLAAGVQSASAEIESANKYLKEKIDGALFHIKNGDNLGQALDKAGHEFPDKQIITDLKIYSELDNFEEALDKLANEWLEESVYMIEQRAEIMNMIAMLSVSGIIAWAVFGTFDMQDQITSAMGK